MDFEARVMDKFDNIEALMRESCDRITRLEASVENHYDNLEAKQKGKEKKFYYIIALMGVGFTITQILQRLS